MKSFKVNSLFLVFITFIAILAVGQAQVLDSMTYTDQEGCTAKVDVGDGIFNNNVYCTGCADPRVVIEKTADPESVAMNPNVELDKNTKVTITLTIKNYSGLAIKGTVWDAISGTNIELVDNIDGDIYSTKTENYFKSIEPTEEELETINTVVPTAKITKYLQTIYYNEISKLSDKKNYIMKINAVDSKTKLPNGRFEIIDSTTEMLPPENTGYPWFFLDKQLERMDGISYKEYNYLLSWDINVDRCALETDGSCPAPTIHKIVYTVRPLQRGTIKLGRSFLEYKNSVTENFDISIPDLINPIIKKPGETELVNLTISNSSPEAISNLSVMMLGDLGYRNWVSFPGREKLCTSTEHEPTNVNMWLNPDETIVMPVKISVPETETEKAATGLYVGYINVCITDAEDGLDNFQIGRSQNCKHIPLVVMVERPPEYGDPIDLGYTNHTPDDCMPCSDSLLPKETCSMCSVQQKVTDVLDKPINSANLEIKYLDENLNLVTDHFTTDSDGIANVTYPYGESLNCSHTVKVSKSDPINPKMNEITAHTYSRQWFNCTPTDTIVGYKPLELIIEAPSIVAAVGAYNMIVTANIPVFDVIYTQATRALYTTVTRGKTSPPLPPEDLIGGPLCGDGNIDAGEECDPPGTLSGWYIQGDTTTYYLCGQDCKLHPQQISGTFNICDQLKQAADNCNETETHYIKVSEDRVLINPEESPTMSAYEHVQLVDAKECKLSCHIAWQTQTDMHLQNSPPLYQILELEEEVDASYEAQPGESIRTYTVTNPECRALKDTYQDTCVGEPNRILGRVLNLSGSGGSGGGTGGSAWSSPAPRRRTTDTPRQTFDSTDDSNSQCTSARDGCCYPVEDGICDPDCEGIYGFCDTPSCVDTFTTEAEAEACYSEAVSTVNCASDPDCTMISWNPPTITVAGVKVIKMTISETVVVDDMPFEKSVTVSAHNTVSDEAIEMWARLTMVWETPATGVKKYVTLNSGGTGDGKMQIKQGIGLVGVGQEFSTDFLPYSPNNSEFDGENNLPTTVYLTSEVFEGTCNPAQPETLTNCYKGTRLKIDTSEENGLGLGTPRDVYYGTLGKVEAPIVITKPALLNISFVEDMDGDGANDIITQVNRGEIIDVGVKVTNEGGMPARNAYVQLSNKCMENITPITLEDGECLGTCSPLETTTTTWKNITKNSEKLELAPGQPSRMDFGTLAPTQTGTAVFSMKIKKGADLQYVYQCFETNAENTALGNLYQSTSTPHNIYLRNIKAGSYSIFVSPRTFVAGNLDISYGSSYVSAPFMISNTTTAYMKDLTATCEGTICDNGILSINGHYFTADTSTLVVGNIAGGGTAPLHIGLRATTSTTPGLYSGTLTLIGHLNTGENIFAGITIEKNKNGIIEFKGTSGKPIKENTLDFSAAKTGLKEQSIEFVGLAGADETINFEGDENILGITEFEVTNAIEFSIKNPNTGQDLNSIEIVAPILKETSFPITVKNKNSSTLPLNLKTSNTRIIFFKDADGNIITGISLAASAEQTVNLVIKPPYGARSMKYLYYAVIEKQGASDTKINLPVFINVPVDIDIIPVKLTRNLQRGDKSCSMPPESDATGECTQEDANIITMINYSRWPTMSLMNYDSNWIQTNKSENLITLDGYDSDILDFNITTPTNIPPGGYAKRIEMSSGGKSKNALIYINVPDDTKIFRETDQGDESLRAIIRATFENTTVSETVKVVSAIEQAADIAYSGIGTNPVPAEWVQVSQNILAFTGSCSNFSCSDTFDISISVPEGQPPATYTGLITINANNNISRVYITLIVMPKPMPVTYEAYDSDTGATQNQSITAPVHITYNVEPDTCGNGQCDDTETPTSCPGDCGSTGGTSCGNETCEPGLGETASTCSYDCTTVAENTCGDGYCASPETDINCPSDCGSTGGTACGDSICGPGENNDNCNVDCIDATDENVVANPIIVRTTPNYYAAQIYDGTNDYTTIDIANNSPADNVSFKITYEEHSQGLPRSWLRAKRGTGAEYFDITESYSDEFTLLAKNETNIPNESADKVNETSVTIDIDVPPLTQPGIYSGKFIISSEVWSGETQGEGVIVFYNQDIFPLLIKVPERIIVSRNQINLTVPDGTTSSAASFSITNLGGKVDLENVTITADKIGQNAIEPDWVTFTQNDFTVYSGGGTETVTMTVTVPEGKPFGVATGMLKITGTLATANDYKNYIMVFVSIPKRLAVSCSTSSAVSSCSTRGINVNVPSSYVGTGGSVPVNFTVSNTRPGSGITVGSRYSETGDGFWDDENIYIGSQNQSEGPFVTPSPVNPQGSQTVQMNISIPVGIPPGTYTGKISFEYQMEKITFPIKISVPFEYNFSFNQTETEVFDGTPTNIGTITTDVINQDTSAIVTVTQRGSSPVSPFWFRIGEPVKWLVYEGDNTLTTDVNITVPATNRTTTRAYSGYIAVVFTATATYDRIPFTITVKNSISPDPSSISLIVGDGGSITTAIGLKNESPNEFNVFNSEFVEFSPIGARTINTDWLISQPANNAYSVSGGDTDSENYTFEVPLSDSMNYDYYDYSGTYTGNVYIRGTIESQAYYYNVPVSINIPKSMEVSPGSQSISGKYDGETASFSPFVIKNRSAVAIENLSYNVLETGLNPISDSWVSGSFDAIAIPACADQSNCSTTDLNLDVTLAVDTPPGTYTADIVISGDKTKGSETKTVLSKVSIAVQVLDRFAIKNNQSSILLVTPPGTGDSLDCEGVLIPKDTGYLDCNPELSCGDSGFNDDCNPWGEEAVSSFTVQNLGSDITLTCTLNKQQTGTMPAETSWLTLEVDGVEVTSSFTVSPTSEKIINVKAQVPQIPKGAYTASVTTSCWGGADPIKARNKTVNVTMSTPLAWGISPPESNWTLSTFSYDYPNMNEGDPLYLAFTAQSVNEATGVTVSIANPSSGASAKDWLSLDRSVLIIPKGGSDTVSVTGNAPIGASGDYSAVIQFKTTLTNEIKTRTINFTVGASLELTSSAITANTTEGVETVLTDGFGVINGTTGTFHTVTYSVLGASGEGTLPVQPAWFAFSEGTSGWNGTNGIDGGNTGLVNVSITPTSGTTPGTYTGDITVTTKRDITVNSVTTTITQSKTIPVTITVGNTLSLDKTSVIKSVDEGTSGTEVITVTNNSTVSGVNIESVDVSGTWQAKGEWVTVTPATPQAIAAGTNTAFTITVSVPTPGSSGDYAGEYTGTVTFVSDKGESKTVDLIVRVNTSVVIDVC